MTPEEKAVAVEQMHFACRKVRLAIAVLEADVPPDESTQQRLAEAVALLNGVIEDMLG